ncbi:MAG TPA: MBL fold metallo-hydrolase [Chloroflexota bacterium]|nr:MBL fold metallo-hydrolase [Chloroflexota bacterium]
MNPILCDLLRIQDGIGLCWLGNNGWLVRAVGKLVAFDLDLDRDSRLQPSPIATAELAPVLDAVFITHEHGDHFGESTARLLAELSRCTYVVPANCVERAERFGIPATRIAVARPRQPLEVAGIPVEPQRALHGHTNFSVYRHANLDDCGYILTLAGRRIFQPGDSVLLQDHLEDLGKIDVLFVSPTLHNMHIAASTTLIETICPELVFPQHFGTYRPTEQNRFWTVGYPDELHSSLSPEMQQRFHKLDQGVIFQG